VIFRRSTLRKKSIIRKVAFHKGAFPVKNPRTSPARSTIVNRTVTPRRPPNADLREREYLTPKEVDRLQDAARKHSRYGQRDATAILIAYRHGLRASELCELTWNMIELDSGRIHVRRAKNGVDSTHPLTGKEIRALRQCLAYTSFLHSRKGRSGRMHRDRNAGWRHRSGRAAARPTSFLACHRTSMWGPPV
jgi:integrase